MIQVSNLYKKFKIYNTASDRLKEIFFQGFSKKTYHHSHEVLKDISLTVKEGETIGILGKNGAGKSTLLKILTGILMPSSGTFHIDGKITGLLELGTGFDSELSGLKNIVTNGLLIGMSNEEIEQQRDAIITFSELGDYINEPVRTYSSGMIVRLAFSIGIHANPECFVIDEALSVGDAHFQQKCIRRIKEFRQAGGAIIFVSHDLNAVKIICDRAIVLDQGMIVAEGTPERAVNHYNQIIADLDEHDSLSPEQNSLEQNFGNQKANISSAKLIGLESKSSIVSSGEKVMLTINISAFQDIDDLTVGFMIRDRFGQDIFGTNSHHLGSKHEIKKSQHYQSVFTFVMDITPGKYTITIALHSQENHIDECYHWIDNVINFEVAGIIGYNFSGICRFDSQYSLHRLGE